MKNIALTILLSATSYFCLAQNNFTFNHGETKQASYFSVIPYENIRGKIIIKPILNGKKYNFILDTGAPTSISENIFKELKLEIIENIPVSDANAKLDSLGAIIVPEITIGGIIFTDIPAVLIKENPIIDCFNADGIIGSNLLRNSIVQFSKTEKTITITNDKNRLNLNPKQGTQLSLFDDQSSPYFEIKLRGKGEELTSDILRFDSGMEGLYDLSIENYFLFEDENIFEILGKAKGSNSVGLYGAETDTLNYKLRLPTLEICNVKLNNALVKTTLDRYSRIGLKILDYGIITIDYLNRKFYFKPNFIKEKDITEKSFSIDLIPKNNQVYVGLVWEKALREKINADDEILSIDNIDFKNMSLCDLLSKESLFKNKKKINLKVKTENGIVDLIIERK